MTVTATNAASGIPVTDDQYIVMPASGTALIINPGDYVGASGFWIAAMEDAQAYHKASGLGIALTRNPAYDNAGRQVVNSAVVIATHGVFRVSASFSGQVLNGVLAYPVTTGSAVNAPTGLTGVGATWNTANPVSVSGGTAAAAAGVLGVAQVLASYPALGLGGTGQMDIRLWPRNADVY